MDSLPFGDNSFDVVLLSEVLEHLPDPTLAMLEGFRVCRKALILTTDEVRLSETERRRKMAMAASALTHISAKAEIAPGRSNSNGKAGDHINQ